METLGRRQTLSLVIQITREQIKTNMTELFRPNAPYLTVDCVLFDEDAVVLIRRGHPPFQGYYALPGGFVDVGETTEHACAREVLEETGIQIPPENLQLIGVYSDPLRDPNRHTVSIGYFSEYDGQKLNAGDDAEAVEIISNWNSIEIAFDHKKIIKDAWKLRGNSKRGMP